jgi:hypothetical protein
MRLPIQAQPVIRERRYGEVLPWAAAPWSSSGIHPATSGPDICPEGHYSCNCAPCINMCCTNEQSCSCSDNVCSCVTAGSTEAPKRSATSLN